MSEPSEIGHGPPPRALGDALRQVLAGFPGGQAPTLLAVVEVWDRVAGSRLAPHTRPGALEGGRLVVIVDDPAWIDALAFERPRLLEALRSELGELAPTDVAFRAASR